MQLLRRGGAWALDYAYVAYWQVRGFIFRGDAERQLSGDRAPVILLPGIYEPWQFMHPVASYLHERGHPVHAVTALGYNRGSVPAMAELVAQYLRERDLRNVVLLAHSKGGLIGKYVMTLPESAPRVHQLIAVNSPFSGSVYAMFALLPSLRAFSPRNRTLNALRANLALNSRITSIYGTFDPHIPGGSELVGARNVQLDVMGHFRILGDDRLLAAIDAALEASPSA
ncbi:alpha/beta hydrolase [Arthrobacter sp. JZ12]|uniref:esterase/lipase family protein n=1 Tax=Arthrobacter sp. JZ12 TaxID=2654190 RepID=UPI002B47ACA7|nr:alpha/beta hydrolase [Arthrobacter sp. JZ12]WRH25667.1 alpha/beta hydrolase [Arthrobacter sp. JZ12]